MLQNIHAFQKPIMKVQYDFNRKRIIAGGLDQHLKFFEVFLDKKDSKIVKEDDEAEVSDDDVKLIQLRL